MCAGPPVAGDRRLPNRVGRRFVAVLIGLVVGVVLVEVGMRAAGVASPIDGSDLAHTWDPAGVFVADPDPEVGFGMIPGYRGTQVYRSSVTGDLVHTATASLDARGFRAHPARPGATRRLLAIGDSTTFGLGVDDDQSWPAHLQAALPAEWEVLNAGVPGRNLHQNVAWLRRELPVVRPEVVVLAFYRNDLGPAVPLGAATVPQQLAAPTWWPAEAGLRRWSRIANLAGRTAERMAPRGQAVLEPLDRFSREEDLVREFDWFVRAAQAVEAEPVVLVLPAMDLADPRSASLLLDMAAEVARAYGAQVIRTEPTFEEMDPADRVVLPAERHASPAANLRIAEVVRRELRGVDQPK